MDTVRIYLRKSFLSWEIMRGIYSLLVLAVMFRLMMAVNRTAWEDWLILALGPLLLFNVCYCLGPVTDCLLCVLLGVRMGRLRYLLAPAPLLVLYLVYHYFWPTFGFLAVPILRLLE